MAECNESLAPDGSYDLSFHVGGIFIILGVAFIGTFLPILSKSAKFVFDPFAFLLVKCVGMGVILATGFVHMLSPAMEVLSNPCLPEKFTQYKSWACVIAALSCLVTQLIQTAAINHFKYQPQTACHDADQVVGSNDDDDSSTCADSLIDGCCDTERLLLKPMSDNDAMESHSRKITAYILEFGVTSHSVLIGMTLGVTRGSDFVSLLIAICFHQFFEGFALASSALDAGFDSLRQPLLMTMIYAVATPIGQSIGIGIAQSYSSNSPSALFTEGIFDAISAGILIYDALVNLISTNVTHSKQFASLSLIRKVLVFLALWLGAGIMAAIGYWA